MLVGDHAQGFHTFLVNSVKFREKNNNNNDDDNNKISPEQFALW